MGDRPLGTSRAVCLQSIQAAADAVGEPLSMEAYDAWREETIGWRPASRTIMQIGRWADLCEAAGVEPASPGPPSRTFDEFLAAVISLRERLGEWPTQQQYIDNKRPGDPSHTLVYEDGAEDVTNWQDAIDAARSWLEG